MIRSVSCWPNRNVEEMDARRICWITSKDGERPGNRNCRYESLLSIVSVERMNAVDLEMDLMYIAIKSVKAKSRIWVLSIFLPFHSRLAMMV